MIDPGDGSIRMDSPRITISRELTLDQFEKSALARVSREASQNAPWSRYQFKPVVIAGESFAGDICFKVGRVYSITLCVLRKEAGDSWAEWSENGEIERRKFHDSLLASALGIGWEQRRFGWGSLYSVFDQRSGGSNIEIIYG